jgi:FtsZ-binding cell division protein ZapB
MATFDEVFKEIEDMKSKGERIKRKGQQAQGKKEALTGEIQHIYQSIKKETGIEISSYEEGMEHLKEIAKTITEKKNQMAEILRDLGEDV